MTTIHQVLDELRTAKRSNGEMGDQRENLFASYLRLDPQQQERFSVATVRIVNELPGIDA